MLRAWKVQAGITMERGAGVGLGGESDPAYVQILAERRANTSLKMTNQDGREDLIKP
jgi:hypothetical protein